jgi:transposase
MGLVVQDDGWRIPDELWEKIEPLLPPRPFHPLGCHNPRVPDRDAMNAILFRLRTGCQWNALDATGICSCSSAYRRFREWAEAGVFLEFWRQGLLAYDRVQGVEWEWLAADAAMTKSPPRGRKQRAQSHRQSQIRRQAEPAH